MKLSKLMGILFKPKKSTITLAGSGAKYATPEEVRKLLDELRGGAV